ncbi:MAG: hypothetical protein ACJA2M_000797 [Polaribacter sp.]|jgi:hypothetical protein
MEELNILNSKIKELQDLKDNGTIPLYADGMLQAYDELQPLVKKLIIADVSHRRELLLDFLKWQSTAYSCSNNLEGNSKEIDLYLKSNNCG